MADTSLAALRLKLLLTKIREGLRQTLDPSRLQAVEVDNELFHIKVDDGDINAAVIYLRDVGLSADAIRLHKSFEQCRYREVGEWLAEMADGESDEERDQLIEIFGPFPDSVARDDPAVSDRRMMLIGSVARLQKFVDELIGTVEGLFRPKLLKEDKGEGTGEPPEQSRVTPLAAESVDASGEVKNPRDPTAYAPASDVRLKHSPAGLFTTHKQFVVMLADHPEIKRWHPRPNRLLVHLPDWLAFVTRQTEERDEDGLLANQAEIEARTAAIRCRK